MFFGAKMHKSIHCPRAVYCVAPAQSHFPIMRCQFLRLLAAIVIGLSFGASAQSLSQSQLFFDDSGSDQGAFGPNAIITISGNMTFFGRNGGCRSNGVPDIFGAAADFYVLHHQRVYRDGMQLHAVTGVPHTISAFGAGSAFYSQQIGATQPGGSLTSGNYDIVIDECQDGFYDADKDFIDGGGGSPAFTVFVPENCTNLPAGEINEMKASAYLQVLRASAESAAFKKIQDQLDPDAGAAQDIVNGKPLALLKLLKPKLPLIIDVLKEVRNKICAACGQVDEAMAIPFKATTTLLNNQIKKYVAIGADPADPNYQETVRLEPFSPLPNTDARPLFRAFAPLGNAVQQENNLAGALLSSLEKYQGAQQGQDAYWALAHAREIRMYANLLADQLLRASAAWSAFRLTVSNSIDVLTNSSADLIEFQAEILQSGFSLEQQQLLAGIGLDGTDIEALREEILAKDYSFDPASFLAGLDVEAQNGTNVVAYRDLANSMTNVINVLLALPSLDRSQPEIQFTVQPNPASISTTVSFDASATINPIGGDLSYGWDFNSTASFGDGTNVIDSHVYTAPVSGYVGLAVTNEVGKEAIAYQYFQATSSNRPPVFTDLEPTNGIVTLNPGTPVTFSVSATDPENDTLTYQWLNESNAVVGIGPSFTYAPVSGDIGAHAFVVRVNDAHGNTTTHYWLAGVVQPVSFVDLGVTQTQQPSPAQTGHDIVYTITVTNSGPNDATGVMLTNILSPVRPLCDRLSQPGHSRTG